MRNWFYQNTLPECGAGVCIFPACTLHYPENIHIGDMVFINRGVILTAPAPISLGKNVLIGPYAVLNSGNHRYKNPAVAIKDQGHDLAPIHVGEDAWLGAHSVILPGVTVGRGAVVAAGAVVTRDVDARAVVGGVPARVIGGR